MVLASLVVVLSTSWVSEGACPKVCPLSFPSRRLWQQELTIAFRLCKRQPAALLCSRYSTESIDVVGHLHRRVCRLAFLTKANPSILQNFHSCADDVPCTRCHPHGHIINFCHLMAAFYVGHLLPSHRSRGCYVQLFQTSCDIPQIREDWKCHWSTSCWPFFSVKELIFTLQNIIFSSITGTQECGLCLLPLFTSTFWVCPASCHLRENWAHIQQVIQGNIPQLRYRSCIDSLL